VTMAWVSRRRVTTAGRRWMLASVLALLTLAGLFTSLPMLAARLADTVPSGFGGRLTIWRETWPMVRDFWPLGIGVGSYRQGMVVYQQSTRLLFFNHAHNEYLQILTEGGVVLAALAGFVLLAGWQQMATRLRTDSSSVFWIRAGAASGLAAAAAQSVWDTGLRMPANAVLFAILAGIALHEPHQKRVEEGR